ncbi:hypothetical protein ACQE32_08810 [Pantoea sp. FN0302]|uniref:hypothetical protein n=1 Tax=unclassified Pantoea TaxID=2630326 RepID=UPI003CE80326
MGGDPRAVKLEPHRSAAAMVARLHNNTQFSQQMVKAKEEFRRLAAGGAHQRPAEYY